MALWKDQRTNTSNSWKSFECKTLCTLKANCFDTLPANKIKYSVAIYTKYFIQFSTPYVPHNIKLCALFEVANRTT